MRVEVADAFPEADVLAVPVGPAGIPAGGDLQGAARIAEEEDLAAKAGRTAVLFAEEPSKRVVLVGLGPADELDADTVRTAAASVAEATDRIGGTLAFFYLRLLGKTSLFPVRDPRLIESLRLTN